MAETGTQVWEPSVPRVVAGTAALIAAGNHRETITEILEAQGLAVSALDRVEDVSSGSAGEQPAVAVLCVAEAIASCARLVEALATRFAQTPIVVVCSSIQRREVRATLMAGAAGVVVAEDLDSALGPCVQSVQSGQTCVPRGHWRQIEPPVLSTRERQILGLVVMGYMNSQIAERLFVAESTVKTHLSSAFSKLGVRSRNEAVDLILDPERGLGIGILTLGATPLEPSPATDEHR